MRIKELEQHIEGKLKWDKVDKIPDFPANNFQEVHQLVKSGKYTVGVNYTTSNELARWLYGNMYGWYFLLLASTPFIAIIVSIILAITLSNFWLLLGIPLGFIGQFTSNPYNPSRGFFNTLVYILFIVMLWALISGNETLAYIISFYVVPFRINSYLYYHNQDKLKEIALKNETVFIYLYQGGQLGLRDNSSNQSYWHFEK